MRQHYYIYHITVVFALTCLIAAKIANVGVPLIFKDLIDTLSGTRDADVILVPLGLLGAYGALRFSTALFTELREIVFARVTQRAQRTIALKLFRHLHSLSLRFQLERQTGGLSRDIERGTRSVGSLISYTIYSILPTLVEIALVMGILIVRYEGAFALITLVALALYVVFTVLMTNWRTHFRRQANEFDSAASPRAIDSLLNYETVKYFNNEASPSHWARWSTTPSSWSRTSCVACGRTTPNPSASANRRCMWSFSPPRKSRAPSSSPRWSSCWCSCRCSSSPVSKAG